MLKQIGIQAKEAAGEIAALSADKKNQILQSMAAVSYTHLTLPTIYSV